MYGVNFAGRRHLPRLLERLPVPPRRGQRRAARRLGADVPATTFPPKEKLPGLFKSNPTAFTKEVRIDAR